MILISSCSFLTFSATNCLSACRFSKIFLQRRTVSYQERL
nr:MAG TPA: hypothetical protein [Caudoviricetes sp.]